MLNKPVVPIAPAGASKQRKRQGPKGRGVDPQALAEVEAMLSAPLRHDLLIEYLHKINDRYGQLGAPHPEIRRSLINIMSRHRLGHTHRL